MFRVVIVVSTLVVLLGALPARSRQPRQAPLRSQE